MRVYSSDIISTLHYLVIMEKTQSFNDMHLVITRKYVVLRRKNILFYDI